MLEKLVLEFPKVSEALDTLNYAQNSLEFENGYGSLIGFGILGVGVLLAVYGKDICNSLINYITSKKN